MKRRVEFYCGVVEPKQRPRRGKWGNFYTPKETKESQRELAMLALLARNRMGVFSPTRASVTIWAYLTVRRKGDLDNGLKTVKDALEGILYENDRQVDEAHVFRSTGSSRVVVEWEDAADREPRAVSVRLRKRGRDDLPK